MANLDQKKFTTGFMNSGEDTAEDVDDNVQAIVSKANKGNIAALDEREELLRKLLAGKELKDFSTDELLQEVRNRMQ